MRHFIFALLGATTLAGISAQSATAGDLPGKSPSYLGSAYNWTGFYYGVNVGYGWANLSATAMLAGLSAGASEKLSGIVGGGQIGYNWQIGNLVLGLEADIQATAEQKSITGSYAGVTLTETNKIPYFGTARGRLGWAINDWMPYITGGWGYGELSASLTATGAATGTFSASTSHSLWVIGGGVEVDLHDNLSWKIEYLYMDTGTITNNYSTPLGILAVNGGATNNVARLGLNYRF